MARGDKKKIDDLLEAYYLTDSKTKTGKKPTRTDAAREYLANKDLWDSVISKDISPDQYNERSDSFMASMLKAAFESLAPSGQKKLEKEYYEKEAFDPYVDPETRRVAPSFMQDVGSRQERDYGERGTTKRQWEKQQEKIAIQDAKAKEKLAIQQEKLYQKELDAIAKQQKQLLKQQEKIAIQEAKAQAKAEEQEAKAQAVRDFEGKALRGEGYGETYRGMGLEDFDDMPEFQRAKRMREKYIEERVGDYPGAPADSFLADHERRQFENIEFEESQFQERALRDEARLHLEDYDDMSEFQRAKKIRDRYIEERAGDYAGAGPDSFLADHERRQAGIKKAKILDDRMMEAEQYRIVKEKKDAKILADRMMEAQQKRAIQKKALVDKPLRVEDFNNLAEFEQARKIREKYIEERVGDYPGAGPDSFLKAHELRQAGIKKKEKYEEDAEDNARAQFNRLKDQYSRLGTEIRNEIDPIERTRLIQQRNALIQSGKRYAESLDIFEIDNLGQFPFVDPVSGGQQFMDVATSAFQGKDRVSRVGAEVFGQAGTGSFYKRGELFRGTSYASTGAINGVMRALAGIFILFVFIGVFYMVFGPIYDSLIYNFTTIVSMDGDPTLGGKDIPTLFDNVAKVVLVWVPLIVLAGALYKLTALVFEREVGTRTTEEAEWDSLLAGEDSMDLDAGSDPSVFEAYGGGY